MTTEERAEKQLKRYRTMMYMCWSGCIVTRLFNRKIRNRVASQNTRDKRKQYLTDLELQVKKLQAEVCLCLQTIYLCVCIHCTLIEWSVGKGKSFVKTEEWLASVGEWSPWWFRGCASKWPSTATTTTTARRGGVYQVCSIWSGLSAEETQDAFPSVCNTNTTTDNLQVLYVYYCLLSTTCSLHFAMLYILWVLFCVRVGFYIVYNVWFTFYYSLHVCCLSAV